MTKTEQIIDAIRDLSEEQKDQLLNVAVRMRDRPAYHSLSEDIKKEIDQGIAEDAGNDQVTLSEFMSELDSRISRSGE